MIDLVSLVETQLKIPKTKKDSKEVCHFCKKEFNYYLTEIEIEHNSNSFTIDVCEDCVEEFLIPDSFLECEQCNLKYESLNEICTQNQTLESPAEFVDICDSCKEESEEV